MLQRIIFRKNQLLHYYCHRRTSIPHPWFSGICLCCLYLILKFNIHFWLHWLVVCLLSALSTPYFESFQQLFLIRYYYRKHPHQYILHLYFPGHCHYDQILLFYWVFYCSLEKITPVHAWVTTLIQIPCRRVIIRFIPQNPNAFRKAS